MFSWSLNYLNNYTKNFLIITSVKYYCNFIYRDRVGCHKNLIFFIINFISKKVNKHLYLFLCTEQYRLNNPCHLLYRYLYVLTNPWGSDCSFETSNEVNDYQLHLPSLSIYFFRFSLDIKNYFYVVDNITYILNHTNQII